MASNMVSQAGGHLRRIVAPSIRPLHDEAVVGLSGDLVFTKGARSLSIGYRMSSTNAAGAIRLAGLALERMAAAPEPSRPKAGRMTAACRRVWCG